MNKGLRVFFYQIKQEMLQIRVLLLFMILAIFICSYLAPVADFSKAAGERITPWAFPHLINDYICQIVFAVCVVFLFCTAPFQGNAHYYIIQRSGSFYWQVGNILYIIIMSFLFVSFIWIISVVSLIPRLEFSGEWKAIWGTLARTNAGIQFRVPFSVYDYIIGVFSPARAAGISFLLEWACAVWLGLLIYLFNFLTQKPVGVAIASLFVFLDVMINNSWTPKAYLFSPVTLAQLKALSGNNLAYGLTLEYAAEFFIGTILLFIFLCLLLGSGKYRRWKNK